ncbi:MAG TPA: aromatic-ring-hydroxylating dioxygenase subunit beta [Candidatus Sulfotelmatobacter sp.]|nr:aromatic-ring-hydroxylating dioxygenase subunit beta [Candidatus Sulfotelmatobacter sp.]
MDAVPAARAPSLEERFEVIDLYARYAETINDGRLDEWPAFFTEDCRYRVQARENAERDLPLATIRAESRFMLEDRVAAIRNAMLYVPHYWLHMISAVRITAASDAAIEVRANYCIIRTMQDRLSELFQVGRYQDRLVRQGGRLLFQEKLCVYDSLLIPNSLVYPV